jgi:hypothetical protein
MIASAVKEIESQFAQLPRAIQLSVIERLLRQMRESRRSGNATGTGPHQFRVPCHGSRRLGENLMAIRRGEICLVNLNPVQGREQAGSRPVLVISTVFSQVDCMPQTKLLFFRYADDVAPAWEWLKDLRARNPRAYAKSHFYRRH